MKPIMSKPKYVTRDINNLKDMLEQTVALYSDKDAFIKKSKDIYVGVSYKKYKEDVFGLGTELMKRGVSGERVILLSENRYEWCVSFMATTCGNGIIVPLANDINDTELVSKINSVGAKFIVFSEKYRNLIKEIKRKCPTLEYTIDIDIIIDDTENLSFLRLIELGNKDIQNGNNAFMKLEVDNDIGAGIFYGNTIIKDRMVLLSHKNLISSVMGVISFMPINDSSKTLVLNHMSEAAWCICNFLSLIAQGGTICFEEEDKTYEVSLGETNPSVIFVSKEILEELYQKIWIDLGNYSNIRKIKSLMVISAFLIRFNIDFRNKFFGSILKKFGKNLKLIVVIDKKRENKILTDFSILGFDMMTCYEILEACSIVMIDHKKEFMKENVMGVPLPGIKAYELNSNFKTPGELILSGDIVMLGYYDDRKATGKVIKDGDLYTGKIVYRDKNGCFYFSKSKKK